MEKLSEVNSLITELKAMKKTITQSIVEPENGKKKTI